MSWFDGEEILFSRLMSSANKDWVQNWVRPRVEGERNGKKGKKKEREGNWASREREGGLRWSGSHLVNLGWSTFYFNFF